jgi:hypothetical protein
MDATHPYTPPKRGLWELDLLSDYYEFPSLEGTEGWVSFFPHPVAGWTQLSSVHESKNHLASGGLLWHPNCLLINGNNAHGYNSGHYIYVFILDIDQK